MKREELVELVRSAVGGSSYVFHTGEPHKMNGALRVYPAAWLLPPAVKSMKGRAECESTYRITLHLMTLPAAGNDRFSDTEALWAGLERDAAGIVARIAADTGVCSVSNLSLSPARGSLTSHGEVSVSIEVDITMWYYL